MAVNKNALIRYKTIDKCLQNKYRQWTLEDLIEACSEALYEYEGIDKGVSRRTVQSDIQMMRSDKLGYNAPIAVIDRKYYVYEDADYSITNIPISETDLAKLTESVQFLKQFQGFSHFKELGGLVQKLEDHVYSRQTNQKPVIDFEKNEALKGIQFLDELYQSIIKKEALEIEYQSFKARQASTFTFHPYLLKEFRNRWFLIGRKQKGENMLNLALDRFISLKKSPLSYKPGNVDADQYFKDVIGVSVSENVKADEVLIFVTHKHAPYVMTKPLHDSQEVMESNYYGIVIRLEVQHNYELERDILGFGDGMRVIKPARLRKNIQNRLNGSIDLYKTELTEKNLKNLNRKLVHSGTAILNDLYTNREVRKMGHLLSKWMKENGLKTKNVHAKRAVLKEVPQLIPIVFNQNLRRILDRIDPMVFLTKSIYFNKGEKSNWSVKMHQDLSITVNQSEDIEESKKIWKQKKNGYFGWTEKEGLTGVCPPEEICKNRFTIRIHLDDTDEQNGALKVLPGSHKRILSDQEIETIVENSNPTFCNVKSGGVHLFKPLLLHASDKSEIKRSRRVIHLEFASLDLQKGLEWGERMEVNYLDDNRFDRHY